MTEKKSNIARAGDLITTVARWLSTYPTKSSEVVLYHQILLVNNNETIFSIPRL